ncbi:acyltransferase family protein [Pedobacter cryophilus]|uniref:acyltransferase family protein n=1 Tax=Pedobacter cryophilus TaxID=2571271 RepID=UPI00145D5F8C|nr:acyltransferase [Pedobacter cryophilus]
MFSENKNLAQKNLTLEALRGFSSFYVAIGHWVLSYSPIHPSVKFLFSFGQEAVIIFFILSGYVIHTSWTHNINKDLKSYFIKRFRRIYFPFIIALGLSLIILPLSKFTWKEFIGNLLMLQDFSSGKPGVFVDSFMGNAPLWSLSYEWGFYLLFPFVYIAIGNKDSRLFYIMFISFISMLAYILFPNHLFLIPAYLIIWWCGLELSSLKTILSNKTFNVKRAFIAFFPILLLLTITTIYRQVNFGEFRAGVYPLLFLRHFTFAFLFVFLALKGGMFKLFIKSIIFPFHHLAPISYGFYIFHYIIFIQWSTGISWYFDIPLKLIIVFALSYLVEIKCQPIINRYIK